MDITPQDNLTTQPISDDQELSQALAGVMPDSAEDVQPSALNGNGMQFEETPSLGISPSALGGDETPSWASSMPEPTSPPEPATPDFGAASNTVSSSDLDGIKNNALKDLRPLIDRVDLPAEEKFDTYLLLIRSTDDSTLISPAYAAAQGIADEKRKAEALLDIIKEIDYLSKKDSNKPS